MSKTEIDQYRLLKEIVLKNRTYRRFYENHKISEEDIISLVELARLSGFGGNHQSFKFWAILDDEKKEQVFKALRWANYYKDWDGPEKGERPSAYIIMFHDKDISSGYLWEHGLAAQSILLGAVSKGLGGCMFASFNRQEIQEIFEVPENLNTLMVIALGKPKEEVIVDCIDSTGSIKYWRDKEGRHHVPKRLLKEILIIK